MASDKVALVTGSARRRVGNVVARVLAERGYSLAVHFSTSAADAAETVREIEGRGSQALAVQGDLRIDADIDSIVQTVLDRFGHIDLLVNAAAVWLSQPIEQVTADDVRQQWEVNTLGAFLCARRVGLAMCEQMGGGSIINIGDWATARPYPNYSAYFLSKGAIPTMTRSLAVEFASRNPRVRVNCILPGPVMLPDNMTPNERDAVIRSTLLKREGTPEHVAHAVVFLAENEFVTGVCLPVDGGRTIYGGEVEPLNR